jgi:hypothetical protein
LSLAVFPLLLLDVKYLNVRVCASFRVNLDQPVTLEARERDVSGLPCHAAQLVKTPIDSEASTFV